MSSRRFGGTDTAPVPMQQYPGRVLVVDDQEDNRMLMARYLESEGYAVDLAGDGGEARAAIVAHRPDLILLDVMMPGENGFVICRKLKSAPDTLAIPVVLITGLQRKDDRVAGMEAGADDFLSKPVFPEELLARARSLMELASARKTLEDARLAQEVAERKRIHQMFERYVSPKLVKDLLERGEGAGNPLERRARVDAVVMFCDIRGFTRMVEQLTPDIVVGLLNQFFTEATTVAYAHEGTVINMAGDSLLVAFGVPLPQPDKAQRAVQAACEMVRRFRDRALQWHDQYGVHVALGAGISLGQVVAGNVGSPTYMSYTVIGDAVNIAARLMQTAAANEVLLSEPVLEAIPDRARALRPEALTPIRLKGKSTALPIYRIVTQ